MSLGVGSLRYSFFSICVRNLAEAGLGFLVLLGEYLFSPGLLVLLSLFVDILLVAL